MTWASPPCAAGADRRGLLDASGFVPPKVGRRLALFNKLPSPFGRGPGVRATSPRRAPTEGWSGEGPGVEGQSPPLPLGEGRGVRAVPSDRSGLASARLIDGHPTRKTRRDPKRRQTSSSYNLPREKGTVPDQPWSVPAGTARRVLRTNGMQPFPGNVDQVANGISRRRPGPPLVRIRGPARRFDADAFCRTPAGPISREVLGPFLVSRVESRPGRISSRPRTAKRPNRGVERRQDGPHAGGRRRGGVGNRCRLGQGQGLGDLGCKLPGHISEGRRIVAHGISKHFNTTCRRRSAIRCYRTVHRRYCFRLS